MNADPKTLRNTRIFSHLSDSSLEQLSEKLKKRHYGDGDTIFDQNDQGETYFIIAKGEVKLLMQAPSSQTITLAILETGDSFGELALLDNAPRSASAIALGATELFILYRKDFDAVVESDIANMRAMLQSLTSIIRRTNERLGDVAMLNVHGRVAKALIQLADQHGEQTDEGLVIKRELDVTDIAGHASMYPVHVEQILANMMFDHVIMRIGSTYTLLQPDQLRDTSVRAIRTDVN